MGIFGAMGRALTAPGRAVMNAPGMGAVRRPLQAGIRATPGVRGIGQSLGLGPSNPQAAVQGGMAGRLAAARPQPPSQPIPEQPMMQPQPMQQPMQIEPPINPKIGGEPMDEQAQLIRSNQIRQQMEQQSQQDMQNQSRPAVMPGWGGAVQGAAGMMGQMMQRRRRPGGIGPSQQMQQPIQQMQQEPEQQY